MRSEMVDEVVEARAALAWCRVAALASDGDEQGLGGCKSTIHRPLGWRVPVRMT